MSASISVRCSSLPRQFLRGSFGRPTNSRRSIAVQATSAMDTLLFYKGQGSMESWAEALRGAGLPLQIAFNDSPVPDPAAVRFAVGWNPRSPELFQQLPNLVAVQSLGAGVDGFLKHPGLLPEGVTLLRIVDPLMGQRMATWAVWGVINAQRFFDDYAKAQAVCKWDRSFELTSNRDNVDMRCGILGMGVMGGAVATALQALQYPVSCWTRRPRSPPAPPPGTLPLRMYAGRDQLRDFVSQCDVLICMLPLTADTTGIIDAELLSWLPRGAAVINGARGGHVVQEDLLAALDSGQVGSCLLDVFQTEPLPEESPLWRHPRVRITPHVASLTNVPNAVAQTIQNRLHALNLPGARGYVQGSCVDISTGY